MIGDGYSADDDRRAASSAASERSSGTVHRSGRKLGVTNRVMLAQIAYAAGLPEFDVDQVYDLLHNKKTSRKPKEEPRPGLKGLAAGNRFPARRAPEAERCRTRGGRPRATEPASAGTLSPMNATHADDYCPLDDETSQIQIEAVLRRAAELNGCVLDIGCGDGRIAIPLARAGRTVLAIDSDPIALEALRQAPPRGNPGPPGRA